MGRRAGAVLKQITKPARRLFRSAFPRKHDEWSIGIFAGKSPFDLIPSEAVDNPVLTRANVSDVRASFIADPFMLRVNRAWFMFFEILNSRTGYGDIGLATSADGLRWTYQQVVLTERFSVSYPYVFAWMNEYFMVPESRGAGGVRLYQASRFPDRWSCIGTILEESYVDSSIFRHDDRWWLFAEASPKATHDTLRLYYASDLMGPWIEHPQSPVVERNAHMARPAGRVLTVNGRPVRYAQDCYPTYSTQVRAFEITELTVRSFQEREVSASPILRPSGVGWNAAGMHHIDLHLLDGGRWIACVDGRARSSPQRTVA